MKDAHKKQIKCLMHQQIVESTLGIYWRKSHNSLNHCCATSRFKQKLLRLQIDVVVHGAVGKICKDENGEDPFRVSSWLGLIPIHWSRGHFCGIQDVTASLCSLKSSFFEEKVSFSFYRVFADSSWKRYFPNYRKRLQPNVGRTYQPHHW